MVSKNQVQVDISYDLLSQVLECGAMMRLSHVGHVPFMPDHEVFILKTCFKPHYLAVLYCLLNTLGRCRVDRVLSWFGYRRNIWDLQCSMFSLEGSLTFTLLVEYAPTCHFKWCISLGLFQACTSRCHVVKVLVWDLYILEGIIILGFLWSHTFLKVSRGNVNSCRHSGRCESCF